MPVEDNRKRVEQLAQAQEPQMQAIPRVVKQGPNVG